LTPPGQDAEGVGFRGEKGRKLIKDFTLFLEKKGKRKEKADSMIQPAERRKKGKRNRIFEKRTRFQHRGSHHVTCFFH